MLSVADIIIQQRVIIDYVAKQNLLAFASGAPIDHLGLLVGVERLPASSSTATIQFTLSAAQPGVTIIPAGTRVTPGGGNIYFSTVATLEIQAGELTGEVSARCTEAGAIGNGYLPGQINRLVDPLPYVQGIASTTTSEGGADVESDENLRDRIHMAPEAYSNAGSRGAYIAWARSASQLIVDVGVHSPSPGVVHVFPLLDGGEIPGAEMLDRVADVLNAETVRPMTDLVEVLPPQVVSYELYATWYLDRANATSALAIETAVNRAVSDWVLWEQSKLGRDINPDELVKRVVAAGAKRIVINSPAFRVLDFYELAVAGNVVVTYGGMEDG